MSMITHHLSDKLLMAYSAGTLPEAFNLVVATHISVCDACRATLAGFDAVGGALLDDDCATMGADCLANVMARIKSGAATTKPEARPSDAVLPAPLVDAIGGGLDRVQWRAVGGGVRQAILKTSDKASARLLHIPAGAAVPDHGHHGLELTLVLQGAFHDEDARFARGDVEIATQDTQHTPIAEPGQDCICLAATDAPLKFRAILPRLAQPFLRI
ncbi:ChrR family anti-sigma-E factor [Roseibaca sp. V10]|uniref:ChrR family anti-sigma-E factor n=1 Tax=Roseinatronobacter domitianus TaxID=2940293 RepID=A0ABT0M007_9RHOB|nr:ChrR family anti-sigma-E factor [Roseibaca domitiana]MCL1628197.1 ChrR family anti-sigma-E factor [Roseibaca domitiana]